MLVVRVLKCGRVYVVTGCFGRSVDLLLETKAIIGMVNGLPVYAAVSK